MSYTVEVTFGNSTGEETFEDSTVEVTFENTTVEVATEANFVTLTDVYNARDRAEAAAVSAEASEAAAVSASNNATQQALVATNKALEAAESATQAKASELSSANNAQVSTDSAATCVTKASEAEMSAAEALASETATRQLFDQFGDQYLGPHAQDPTTDNEGGPLAEGNIYWNTTDNVLKFYSGSAWVAPEDIATTAANTATTKASEASASADTASTAAATATTKASEASASASSALASKNTATTSASTATTKASEASASASSALASKNTATTKASEATTKASEASASASSALASKNSASTSASTATTKASEASTSASSALASKNLAQEWADNAVNLQVTGNTGKYSAKHHATKAAASASSASTSANTATTKANEASASAAAASLSENNAAQAATEAATKAAASATESAIQQHVNNTDPHSQYMQKEGAGTAAAIKAALLTVDGSGSGLDADLLDGKHGSFYSDANQRRLETYSSYYSGSSGKNIDNAAPGDCGLYDRGNPGTFPPAGAAFYFITTQKVYTSDDTLFQIAHSYKASNPSISVRNTISENPRVWSPWGVQWNSVNDGSGSGMDADLLDGQHGSYYRAWANLTGVPATASRWPSFAEVTGKPATYSPSAHTHTIANVSGLQTALDGKSANNHTHDGRYLRADASNPHGTRVNIPGSRGYILNDPASLNLQGSTETGALVFQLGGGVNLNTFYNLVIEITRNFNPPVIVEVNGYSKSNGSWSDTGWTTNNPGFVTGVGFGVTSDGKAVIRLQNDNTTPVSSTWTSYVQVALKRVTLGWTGADDAANQDPNNYTVTLKTDISGYTWKVTATAPVINWNSVNHGSGSGLDADKLDGQHGAYYQNASNLSSGTVPNARISGSYTGMVNLTGSGNVDFAKFLGNASDTVSAPSYSWTGDTNTGIYRPAADQVAVTTGGVQRALFSSAGISGVGTGLTSLNGSNISTGTVADARLPSTVVRTSRTVNGKALSANISLTAADVGAAASNHSHNYVPTGRTVNGKALSSNISLTASDVGAAASSHTHDDRYYTKSQANSEFWRIGESTGYAPDKDLDTYSRGQGGYLRGSEPNSPPGWSTALNVQTLPGYGDSDNLQIAFPGRSNNRFLMRVGESAGWNPWIEFWHSGNSDKFNSTGTYSGLRAQATTKADVGLSNVPDYPATSSVTDSSNSKFATAGAVKAANDNANGRLPASSYTAADVLTKMKSVDGAGSGLDADLLDGQHGSYYLAWGNLTGKPAQATRWPSYGEISSIPTSFDTVYSYAFCEYLGPTTILRGETVAGSSLMPVSAYGEQSSSIRCSGTWRCMGRAEGVSSDYNKKRTLWLRIS